MPRKPRYRKKPYTKRYKRKNNKMLMYKSPRTIMPQQYTTNFKYIAQKVLVSVGATQYTNIFRTEMFDIDTSFGTTACPGFTELSTLYARYRVLSWSYKFSFSNLEAFPMTLLTGFSNSNIGTASLGITYAGNPLFKCAELGDRIGNGIKTLRGRASVVKIVGTKQPLYDDLYTGSTLSATLPTAGTVWLYAGVISSQAMTVGVNMTCEITLKVTLYRPFFMSG